MKKGLLFLSLLLFSLTNSSSFAGEDSPEFFQLPTSPEDLQIPDDAEIPVVDGDAGGLTARALDRLRYTGVWAFRFVLVTPEGKTHELSGFRENSLIKPASTMKLFTGWMALQKKKVTDAYLTNMLKTSDNQDAQKALSLSGGTSAFRPFYASSIGMNSKNFVPIDGSGLSHSNRVTATLEVDLLKMIHASADYDRFKQMLATPLDGTLGVSHRFLKFIDPIYAKTGTLNYTVTLAGFVETPGGVMIFSILGNQLKVTLDDGRKLIDDIVEEHAMMAPWIGFDPPVLEPKEIDPYQFMPAVPVWLRPLPKVSIR